MGDDAPDNKGTTPKDTLISTYKPDLRELPAPITSNCMQVFVIVYNSVLGSLKMYARTK